MANASSDIVWYGRRTFIGKPNNKSEATQKYVIVECWMCLNCVYIPMIPDSQTAHRINNDVISLGFLTNLKSCSGYLILHSMDNLNQDSLKRISTMFCKRYLQTGCRMTWNGLLRSMISHCIFGHVDYNYIHTTHQQANTTH